MKKLVSVAMLAYNHENYISQAIESILSQKVNFEYEVIIGEDFSTDKTLKIIKEYENKYPNKIKVLSRDKNIGVVKNIIEVYSNCSGEYIALLEGDDYWTDEYKLQKSIDFLEKNKEYIGTFHNIEVIDENEYIKIEHPYNRKQDFSDINSQKEHFQGKIMMTLTMVFRNVFLEEKNLKEYSEMLKDVKYVCDYSLKSFLLNFGKFKYLNEVMGRYRHVISSGSSWSAQGNLIKNEDFYYIYADNIVKYPNGAYDLLILNYLILNLKLLKDYILNKNFVKVFYLFMNFKCRFIKIKLIRLIYQKIREKYFKNSFLRNKNGKK